MGMLFCRVSHEQEHDWLALFEKSVATDARMPSEAVRKHLKTGSMHLHKTSDANGQLLCFSMVTFFGDFAYLNHLVEDDSKRSLRAASKHVKHLLDALKESHPALAGLIVGLEMSDLSHQGRMIRQRRLAFFRRLGARRLRKVIALPNYAMRSPRLCELLFITCNSSDANASKLDHAIDQIFRTLTVAPAAKNSGLKADEIARLSLAKRSDAKNDDWISLYIDEFPPEERRDVCQLRRLVQSGRLALHETRSGDGHLLTWSISQRYAPEPEPKREQNEALFWLGAWTVTRRSAQSMGLGRLHFPKVIAALKSETPDYIGRVTEIESAEGLAADSQPARRAAFYKRIGLMELTVPYEMPLYQPADATQYIPQAKLGKGIKGQLLIAPFKDGPISGKQVRSIVRRIYEQGYNVSPDDPYMQERLSLIDESRENYLAPMRENWLPSDSK